MPRVALTPLAPANASNQAAFYTQVRQILGDFETQLRGNAYTSSSLDGKVEAGLQSGDPMFRFTKGLLQVGMFDGKRPRFLQASDLDVIPTQGLQFLGLKSGTALVTAAGTLALFPTQNDWGFYNRTVAGGTWFLVFNIDGATLKSVQLV